MQSAYSARSVAGGRRARWVWSCRHVGLGRGRVTGQVTLTVDARLARTASAWWESSPRRTCRPGRPAARLPLLRRIHHPSEEQHCARPLSRSAKRNGRSTLRVIHSGAPAAGGHLDGRGRGRLRALLVHVDVGLVDDLRDVERRLVRRHPHPGEVGLVRVEGERQSPSRASASRGGASVSIRTSGTRAPRRRPLAQGAFKVEHPGDRSKSSGVSFDSNAGDRPDDDIMPANRRGRPARRRASRASA